MKKAPFIMLIGLLMLPLRSAQEQKETKPDIFKNLQIVEKAEALPPRLQSGYNSITAKSMMAMLVFLSSDNLEGRETGTRGYDTAAEYAQSFFSLWRLEPGGDAPQPASTQLRQMKSDMQTAKPVRSYLQEFELKEAVETSASARLEIVRPGGGIRRTVPFSQGIDFIFNSSLPVEISASLVFTGYGISEKSIAYDDLAAVDVKDRIVMILSDAPGKDDSTSPFQKKDIKEKYFPTMPGRQGGPAFTRAAEIIKRGAVAVLIVKNSLVENGDIHHDIIAQQQIRDDKPILPDSRKKLLIPGAKPTPWEGKNIVKISREMANAILETANETVESLQKKIAAKYKPHSFSLPGANLQISNHVRFQLLKSANVIAFLEGSDPQLKNQAVVIGGHLDHLGRRGDYIYNGAEDNASGAVGVLAIARAMASNPEKPKRSTVFCLWTGEEEGLLGSRYYVEHPLYPLADTVAYINLDMIAQAWDEKGLQRMMRMMNMNEGEALLKKIKPENFLPVSYSYEAFDLKNALLEANRHIGFDILYRESPKTLERMMGGSDHAAFAMAGEPWAFFMSGMSDIYHTPADSMEKFSGETMEKVSRLIYLATFLLADK
ncbi:MAG: M20/M25/M40 family metallo-hydrolase [Chrysiogenales bacterium]